MSYTTDSLAAEALRDFIDWLYSRRDLSICNFTSRNFIYWPIGDTEHLIKDYLNEEKR